MENPFYINGHPEGIRHAWITPVLVSGKPFLTSDYGQDMCACVYDRKYVWLYNECGR